MNTFKLAPGGLAGRAFALAIGSAVIAGTLALAGCGSATASASAPTVSTDTSTTGLPAGQDTPSSFAVESMTFVSDTQGWALGTVKCGSHRCPELLGTTNGGSSWHKLTAPAPHAGGPYNTCPSGSPCVTQIRFASSLIGYAFDPSLYVTTDGGHHWKHLTSPTVSSLEAADGTVVRVAYPGMGCSGAPYKVQQSPIGATPAWQILNAPKIVMICPPVLYRQGPRLVLVGYGNPAGGVRATAELARSTDDGAHWASGPDKCGGKDGYASAVTIAPPNALIELCDHQGPGKNGKYSNPWIRVSGNDGATFGPDRTVPALSNIPSGYIASSQVAAASASRILVTETGPHGTKVFLTANGGRTWTTTLTPNATGTVLLVGFEDPQTARIAQGNTVWTTHNGGRTWTTNHFPA